MKVALSELGALGVAVVAPFAVLPPPSAAAVAAAPLFALVAITAAWAGRERELLRVRDHARACRAEREGLARPAPPPRVHGPDAVSLLSRIASVERLVLRAEADVLASRIAAERSQAVRTRFTAAMSHDIKAPLSSIVGLAKMLERKPAAELSAAQKESVVMVRRGAQELLRLLSDLLDNAKLDVGRLSLTRAPVPSVAVLTEAVAEAQSLVEPRPIRIEASLQPGLPPLDADRARLVQAIVAVIRHSARGLPSGRLLVSARRAAATSGRPALEIEVRDPERVVSADELAHAFEPFRPARSPEGGRPGGLRLALSLARRLARLHDGDVTVSSHGGEGTAFVITIPTVA